MYLRVPTRPEIPGAMRVVPCARTVCKTAIVGSIPTVAFTDQQAYIARDKRFEGARRTRLSHIRLPLGTA